LIGQTAPKNKGKISRLLAAKASLSARVDALGDKDTREVGTENRVKVEARIRQLEGKMLHQISGTAKRESRNNTPAKYQFPDIFSVCLLILGLQIRLEASSGHSCSSSHSGLLQYRRRCCPER
jgi:hypothetical protein